MPRPDWILSAGITCESMVKHYVIDKPNDAICNYWSLACEGDKAHIIIMQHVTKEHIDLFIEHLLNSKYTIIKL